MIYALPRKPAALPVGYSFKLVDQQLLRSLLNEPAKAVATAVVLQDHAHALRKRVHRGGLCTKAEIHRTRVTAATAVAALRALRLNNEEAHRAADSLSCFLRDEAYEASALGGAA